MKRFVRGALTVGAAILILATAGSVAAMEAEDCQGCHADPSIVKEGGRYLYVDPVQYERTSHAGEGCPACHDSVTDAHPEDGLRPSRASCGDCHDAVAEEYEASAHAGNADCTDCHNPHRVKTLTVVSGVDMNRVCTGCHQNEDVVAGHAKWLLQADLHISALPCVTCHTGSEDYVITFYIEKVREPAGRAARVDLASFEDLAGWVAGGKVERLVDVDGDGSISLAELRSFRDAAKKQGYRLWGMMTPEEASHSYATLDNRWDCTFCHASGPEAAQTCYVAFPDGRGAYQRVAVEKGAILDAVYGTPDFYMVGATRNRTLSIIGLAIVGAGLLMPIGHGTLRLLTMKNRREG